MSDNNQIGEEIDLKDIFYLILRNKYLIIFLTGITIVSSAIYAVSLKRVWSGNFQIVLRKKDTKIMIPSLQQTGNIFETMTGGQSRTGLNTQIEILKSPSVLMPIFEYVKDSYNNDGENIDDLSYKKWFSQSFNIDLGRKTEVLNVEYRDKKKDLILSVLRKISNTYKDYSGKTKLRELNSGINYIESQIEIYKKKQLSSLRALQDFGYENDLSTSTLINGENGEAKINIEILRVSEASKIRKINNLLKKINEIPDNSKSLIYFETDFPEFSKNQIRLNVLKINDSFVKAQANLFPGDEDIIKLENKLNTYIPILKRELITFLKSKKYQAEASYDAASRDKETITKYKQLKSNSLMDEKTLTSLIVEKRKLSLQKAKTSDPWELITNPTLTKYPVAPSRKKITMTGAILGFIFSLSLASFLEKKKGFVLSKKALEKKSGFPIIKSLNLLELEKWESIIKLFSKSNIFTNRKEYNFLQIGAVDDFLINELRSLLNNSLKGIKVSYFKNIQDSLNSTETILLVQLGKLTNKDLEEMSNDLNYQENNIKGIIYLK